MSDDPPLPERIAIVGMAVRVPGARNPEEFWANLAAGVESTRSFTPEELDAAGVDAATRADPMFVNSGALADDLDAFDADFFGISRREAQIMDPQHRVLLETAWQTLERAGYDPARFDGAIGVFGGVAPNTYRALLQRAQPDLLPQVGDYLTMIASEREYAITRIAYKLDLRGASLSVNTACSSSGVAIHLACQSLLSGENDLCLVGGARVRAPLTAGYLYVEDGIPSPDGHCRAFDADARGTAIGNGAVMIALKRLSDAIADGDRIHALIRGTAVNNDGIEKVGFTAPSIGGQSEVIAEAQAVAEVDAHQIQYLEAHGTGTAVGDPIEITAATRAFQRTTDQRGFCAVGSVKTNIGHLDAAAGVAGVIKTALALEHEQLPPSLHYVRPNPQIDFENSPFFVNDRLRDWPRGSIPRLAGVNSFGLGGANVHVVLEEAPRPQPTSPAKRHQLLVWSARSASARDRCAQRLAAHLREEPSIDLADVAYTLQIGRRHFSQRAALVVSESDDVTKLLADRDPRRMRTGQAPEIATPITFLFPGGGAQYPGMGRDLYTTEPVYRSSVDECLALLEGSLANELRALLLSDDLDDPSALERPSRALPLLFTVEVALAQLWQSWGVRPDSMIGHSMGEYTAAHLAGVVTLEEALHIVKVRGELFETLTPGAMLQVALDANDPRIAATADLSIAAVNQTGSCVVSGTVNAIEALQRDLERQEIDAARVHISVAAHSQLVEPILAPFREALHSVRFRAPRLPYLSNVTGTWIQPDEACDPDYWVRHLRQTVRFAEGLDRVLEDSDRIFIEIGPGQTLSGFARQHPRRQSNHTVLSSLRHPREVRPDDAFLLSSLAGAWLAGAEIDWTGFHGDERRLRVPLPTYPFERIRAWVDAAESKTPSLPPPTASPAAPMPTSGAELARPDRILGEICDVVQGLTGLAPEEIDVDSTFLELGFDSLLLTQANAQFRRRFDHAISLRQLFEGTPTPRSLAEHLDGVLAPDALVASAPPAPPRSAPSPKAAPLPPAEGHGPWKPAATERDGLTDRQRRHLDQLIERFNAKTRGSKEHTQSQRDHLSDPRTAAGFRLAWKELVYPIVVERAEGATLWDVDGNEWLDLSMGFGVTLLGHSPPRVVNAVRDQLSRNMAIGPQTPLAGEVAQRICRLTGVERVAFCNTGSEAVLAAIRAARTVTGRDRIVVFRNSYHGLFDEVIVRGLEIDGERHTVPVAPGIPQSAVENVLVLEYGDPASLAAIEEHATELAAVLVEPIQSRQPDLQPAEFVRELRVLTERCDIPLVFDEMVTGFRLHPGGAQAWYGVKADIATYGKVVAGGMPIGIVAGCSRYLDALDGGTWNYGDDSVPESGVTWFAGTFVRHPLALAAAKAMLDEIAECGPRLQEELSKRTRELVESANDFFVREGYPVRLAGFASLLHFRFDESAAPGFRREFAGLYFHHLRDLGIHCHEGRPHFLTRAHRPQDVDRLLGAIQSAAVSMREAGFFPPAAPEPEYPLTDGQKEIWLASTLDPDASRAFHLSAVLDLTGPLDHQALETALGWLVDRHEALRLTFHDDGTVQRARPRVEIRPTTLDLRDQSSDARRRALEEFQRTDAERPFDLAAGPLVRFHVLALERDRTRVVLTAHHLVCDGWSLGVLVRDLGVLYTAALRGSARPRPLETTFGQFVQGQAERQQGQAGAEARSRWAESFRDEIPVLDLPTDRERPAVKTFRGGQEGIQLEAELLDRLRRVSAERGSTQFSTLLAAYAAFLKRLTGGDDIVVGVATAGQPAAGSRDLVGHCANLYPLRLRTGRDAPFPTHEEEVRRALIDCLDTPDFTLGSLLEELSVPRDPARTPLLSTMITYETETADLAFDSLELKVSNSPKRYCMFDLELYLTADSSGLRVEFHYNRDLFDASTIQRWLQNYQVLLGAALDDADRPVRLLSYSGSDERRLLASFHDTATEFPGPSSIPELLAQRVVESPNGAAVRLPGAGDEPPARWSYAELDRWANRLAHHLHRRGIGPGDVVGICLDRSPRMVGAVLGVLKTGAAYLPLDPRYPSARLATMWDDSGARLWVRERATREVRIAADPKECDLDRHASDLDAESADPLNLEIDPESLAYVMYTSGSTGRPKGVEIPHRCVTHLLSWMAQTLGFDAQDRLLAVTTLSFDLAVVELLLPLAVGGEIVIARRDDTVDAGRLAQLLADEEITMMQATPATWRLFQEEQWSGAPNLKILCGGEALPRDLADFLLPRCASLWNLYGPTETTVYSTGTEISKNGARITIGPPIANTRIQLLDAHLNEVPLGAPGELVIGGAGVARGYRNRPNQTAERFLEDPLGPAPSRRYRTGDLGRWTSGGEIEFLGRADDQVKVRGVRIELGEIESVLNEHPDVSASAVVARESGSGETRLVAFVVAADGAELVFETLRRALAERLPEAMLPHDLIPLPRLPRTPNGKIDRRALRSSDTAPLRPTAAAAEPRTETEKAMVPLWAELLGRPQLGIDDDFFDSGGSSLQAARLVARIREQFEIELPLRALFEHRTIARIAEVVEALCWQRDAASTDRAAPGDRSVEIEL